MEAERARPDDDGGSATVRSGPHTVVVDGAVYAWTEPRHHLWSAVLPLLLVPPLLHVLVPHGHGPGHSHWWLIGFLAVWMVCWVMAVPYDCHVAYRHGRVARFGCATRGTALRLASVVRKRIGAPG